MKRVIVGLLLAAVCVFAQEAKPAPAATQEKTSLYRVYELKHCPTVRMVDLIRAVILPSEGQVNWVQQLNAVTVTTRDPKILDRADEIVKRYDRPLPPEPAPSDVELTVYILLANGKATSTAPLPPALQGVAQELGRELGLNELRLLDTAVIRSSLWEPVRITGAIEDISPIAPEMSSDYQISFKKAAVFDAAPGKRRMRFSSFEFVMRWYKNGKELPRFLLGTDLTLTEGQKGVLGKSKIGVGDASLVLVVMGRVVD